MASPMRCCVLSKTVRAVPEVKNLTGEFVAIGRIEESKGKVLIDTRAQVSMIKRDAFSAALQKTDLVLKGISGRILKIYGKQEVSLTLKPGVRVPGSYIVSNLPRGYLAVIGCDILNAGSGKIDLEKGSLRLFGREIWLNRLKKGESVPDPRRSAAPHHKSVKAPDVPVLARKDKLEKESNRCERFLYCCKDVELPARCEKLLQLKASKFGPSSEDLEGTDIVVEPIGTATQGVYLARTLTRMTKNRCWVKVVNVSTENVTLSVNSKLGTIEEVELQPKRKLLVLADSHGRGLQHLLAERIPSDIGVTVHFMPNAKLKTVISNLKSESQKLNSNDLIIVLGGSNDVGDWKVPYSLTLRQAFRLMPESWNARIAVMSIMDRYDVNLRKEIKDANRLSTNK